MYSRPMGVGWRVLPVRENRRTPRFFSSVLRNMLSAGEVMYSSSAAFVMVPQRASVQT